MRDPLPPGGNAITIGLPQIGQSLLWKSWPIGALPFRERKAKAQPAFSSPMNAWGRAVIYNTCGERAEKSRHENGKSQEENRLRGDPGGGLRNPGRWSSNDAPRVVENVYALKLSPIKYP
jgi:hypothetical protein